MASSFASGDTEAAPTDWKALESHAHDGDFARLMPLCQTARAAFHQVAECLDRDPEYLPRVRRLVHYEQVTSDADADAHPHRESSFLSSADDDEPPPLPGLEPPGPRFGGYYRLSLCPGRGPGNPDQGWVLGKGRRDRNTDATVDLLLAPEGGVQAMGGRHCRLKRDLHTGLTVLMASSKHRVLINGSTWLRGRTRCDRDPAAYQTVVTPGMSIAIAGHTYLFQHTDIPPAHDQALRAAAAAQLNGTSNTSLTSSTLSLVPDKDTVELHGYLIWPPTRGGSTCRVALAADKATGKPVIIKSLMKNRRTRHSIDAEIKTLRHLDSHARIVRLIKVIDPHGTDLHRVYQDNEGIGVLLVLEPASVTLLQGILTTWPSIIPTKHHREVFLLELASQAADGLSYMHSKGIMHRDIKPENLAFVTTDPVQLVILDLGAAEHATTSINHMLGTTFFFAPELWALKLGRSQEPFTNKVDVYALGATLYEMLTLPPNIFPIGKPENRTMIESVLQLRVRSRHGSDVRVWQLIQHLLEPDPIARLSAAQAVEWIQPRLKDALSETTVALAKNKKPRRQK